MQRKSDRLPAFLETHFQRSKWLQRLSLGFIRRLIGSYMTAPEKYTLTFQVMSNLLIRRVGLDNAPPDALRALSDAFVARTPDKFTENLARSLLKKQPGLTLEVLVTMPEDILAALPSELLEGSAKKLVSEVALQNPKFVLSQIKSFKYRQECYSQEGEDLILARLFKDKIDGFYVDVGAHHPIRFSNTYLLYLKGWRGINVDATPNSMREFEDIRPRDINIECLVSSKEDVAKLYLLNEPALNTPSLQLARQRTDLCDHYKITHEVDLPSRRLDSILNEHLPPGQQIDVLNVDVEGSDLDVLRSNDWTRYRPTYVLVELLNIPDVADNTDCITEQLVGLNYMKVAQCFNTAFFKLQA